MAYTYLILNLSVLFWGWFFFRDYINVPTKNWWITLVAVLILTAIFDNIMIAAGLFSYNPTLILGIYVGLAPIEDFFYAILAVLLLPAAWSRFAPKVTKVKAR